MSTYKYESKVNQEMIYRVKQLRAEGKTQEQIAMEVGLTQGTISVILRSQGLGGYLVKLKRRKESV
jgi:transcriptional regulator with XRE-family HTH domain